MLRRSLLALLALAFLASKSVATQECDCHNLSLAPSPVCGVDNITYINRCVAECQGVAVKKKAECGSGASGLHLKAGSGDEGQADSATIIMPTVNYTRVDEEAVVDADILSRFSSEGFRFAAKVLLKGTPDNADPGMAVSVDGEASLVSNRTLLAARLTSGGHLYLKSVHASETDSLSKQAALAPRLPKVATAAKLASLPKKGGRKLLMTKPDGREEIDTTAYPYSAVGLLSFVGQEEKGGGSSSICSAALIGRNTVLTAGHCVYDTQERMFYDLDKMAFYPNQHGGKRPTSNMAIKTVMTFFNNADKPLQCEDGTWRCQSLTDWEVDFAVLTLEEEAGDTYGWLGMAYDCGSEAFDVNTAGYPGDLPDCPLRMYGDSGALYEFDACETGLRDSVVSSSLDIYPGQSGSAVWDSAYMVRALVNAMGAQGEAYHRTMSKWVYESVKKELDAASD